MPPKRSNIVVENPLLKTPKKRPTPPPEVKQEYNKAHYAKAKDVIKQRRQNKVIDAAKQAGTVIRPEEDDDDDEEDEEEDAPAPPKAPAPKYRKATPAPAPVEEEEEEPEPAPKPLRRAASKAQNDDGDDMEIVIRRKKKAPKKLVITHEESEEEEEEPQPIRKPIKAKITPPVLQAPDPQKGRYFRSMRADFDDDIYA